MSPPAPPPRPRPPPPPLWKNSLEQTLAEMFSHVEHLNRRTVYGIINDLATDEQRLELITKCELTLESIHNPTKEMERLHAMKWKL